jgi:hypothetical protein
VVVLAVVVAMIAAVAEVVAVHLVAEAWTPASAANASCKSFFASHTFSPY